MDGVVSKLASCAVMLDDHVSVDRSVEKGEWVPLMPCCSALKSGSDTKFAVAEHSPGGEKRARHPLVDECTDPC